MLSPGSSYTDDTQSSDMFTKEDDSEDEEDRSGTEGREDKHRNHRREQKLSDGSFGLNTVPPGAFSKKPSIVLIQLFLLQKSTSSSSSQQKSSLQNVASMLLVHSQSLVTRRVCGRS